MVRSYLPVINTLAKGLDIRLGHRVTNVVRRYNGVKVTVENGKTFIADAAIAELGVGLENKIILHFENVFWPNVEFLGVVAGISYGCSYFLNLHKAARHPVLVYMPSGRLAKDIEKMSDEAAANFAFVQLKKILPDASSPIQYLVSRWGSDINSLGEATSMCYPGSVHGAYSTGMMAAEDCRMRVLERYGELDLFQPVMGEMASLTIPLQISRM
ncbi:unnamed protein product [Trifolium pratense]|nr:unnamed protein product [Trifolium pratense]